MATQNTERTTQFPTLKASEGYENTNNGYVGTIAKRFASAKSVGGCIDLEVDCDVTFRTSVESVQLYVDDLLECEEVDLTEVYRRESDEHPWDPAYYIERVLLNGADDWRHYSDGACALCYDGDLADRFGISIDRARENGLELQALALREATNLIIEAIRFLFA